MLHLEIPNSHEGFKKLAKTLWKKGGAHEELVKNGIKSGQLHEFTLHQWIWNVWSPSLQKVGVKFSTFLACLAEEMVVKDLLEWVLGENSWEHAIRSLVTILDQKVEECTIQLKDGTEGQDGIHEHDQKKIESTETIYVGSKPVMRYVMTTVGNFLQERPEKIKILARGRAISRAVDVAEVLRQRYLKEFLELEDVQIGTGKLPDGDTGIMRKISEIAILLHKVKGHPS